MHQKQRRREHRGRSEREQHAGEQAKRRHDRRARDSRHTRRRRVDDGDVAGDAVHAHVLHLKVRVVVVRRRPDHEVVVAHARARLREDLLVTGKRCEHASSVGGT